MSYKVLIPSEISEEGIVFLRERGCEINRGTGTTPEAIRRDVVDCDAILARTELYPAEVLEAAPRLKVIARSHPPQGPHWRGVPFGHADV